VLVGAWLFAALGWWAFARPYTFFDLRIYHGAVTWWLNGHTLYEYAAPDSGLGFTYPPFAALLMLPMAALPPVAAGVVSTVASVAVFAWIMTVLVGPVADRMGWPRWVAIGAAIPLAGVTEPIRETLGFGQVNVLLLGLLIADVVGLRLTAAAEPPARFGSRAWWRQGGWAGAGVGLAAAVKLTPALFIVYFVLTRQWRAARNALAAAALATGVGALIAPTESRDFFGSVLWQTGRVGFADLTPNQSIGGILARLYDTPDTPTLLWLTFSLLALALGLSRAGAAHRDGDELAALALVGLAANAISPISWSHHLVYVVPALVILGDTALRRRTRRGVLRPWLRSVHWPYAVGAFALYLLFVVSPIWFAAHPLHQGVSHYADGAWGVLAENSLALAVLALLALLPWRAASIRDSSPTRRSRR